MATSNFRLALIQLAVGKNKAENLSRAVIKIKEAASGGANVVSLPECFNSPYGTQYFKEYSEPVPDGQSCKMLQNAAMDNNVYLIGGSIPESCDGKLYNTSTVWCPQGNLLATYRKIHLFDIDVPGKITFKESEALSPGNSFTSFDTPWCKIGLGICYDMRFAEVAQVYRDMGCKVLVYPGAFNMTTGPAHWQLLSRGRALDNQVYVATPSPARDTQASYVAWGHSTVVSPWGEVVVEAGDAEEIVFADINLDYLKEIRSQIPISAQGREDLYKVSNLQGGSGQRVNETYQLESKKVAETFSVEELSKKTVFCRCWKSKKFPLCDGAHGRHNRSSGDNLGPLILVKS